LQSQVGKINVEKPQNLEAFLITNPPKANLDSSCEPCKSLFISQVRGNKKIVE
jgi:hypothetical protein